MIYGWIIFEKNYALVILFYSLFLHPFSSYLFLTLFSALQDTNWPDHLLLLATVPWQENVIGRQGR